MFGGKVAEIKKTFIGGINFNLTLAALKINLADDLFKR